MGAVATLLKAAVHHVTGSDSHVYPPMSTILREQGIPVIEGYRPENLDPAPDLVVIGNAMSRGNPEVEAVLERRLRYASLAEVLREFFIRGKTSLVVTGTHGKTTTSALLAWVLEHAGRRPGFMIGGVPENFGVGAKTGGGDLFVSEGDEYDTAFFDKRSKFLHYLPDCVIINNIEYDHADIFASIEEIELAFARLVSLVPRNGLIVANAADPRVMRVTENAWCRRVTFSIAGPADWTARDLVEREAGTEFTIAGPHDAARCFLPLHGVHNASNALGVAALSSHVGVPLGEIVDGFAAFRGVQRRLQRLPGPDSIILYDDFAHHPTAIAETLRAVRAAHPGHRVWALFEPRSNTMVRNIFQRRMVEAFRGAEIVLFGPIHRAEKIPSEDRLDLDRLVADLGREGIDARHLHDVNEILAHVARGARPDDAIVVMSNGAFGGLAGRLPAALAHALNPEGS